MVRFDPSNNALEEMIYENAALLKTRRLFQLDSKDRVRNTLLFDKENNVIGRTEFGFDKENRLVQERRYLKKDKLVRILLHQYDADGQPNRKVCYVPMEEDPSQELKFEPAQAIEESDYPTITFSDAIDSGVSVTRNGESIELSWSSKVKGAQLQVSSDLNNWRPAIQKLGHLDGKTVVSFPATTTLYFQLRIDNK